MQELIDYEKFVLTDSEQFIFNKFKYNHHAKLNHFEYFIMKNKHLVMECSELSPLDIGTVKKRVSLSRIGNELKAYRKRYARESCRYWITTAIAIAALILSILAFLKKTEI